MCALVDGAAYLFCNEYEEALIERKSSWSGAEILDRVGVRVTTLGPAGARIERAGAEPVFVAAVPEVQKLDPTGTGDAFRSGFLAAVAWGLPLERAAQLGNMLAVHVAGDGRDAGVRAEARARWPSGWQPPTARPRPRRSPRTTAEPAGRAPAPAAAILRNENRRGPLTLDMPEGTALVRAVPSVMFPASYGSEGAS